MKRNILCVVFLGLWLAIGGLHAQAPPAGKADPKAAKAGKADTKKAPEAATEAASALVDVNRASADELKKLPGIGDAYSAAIIKNRPYANKTQLTSRKVIPNATYEKIRDRIIAKQ